jgi:hypothetical protein
MSPDVKGKALHEQVQYALSQGGSYTDEEMDTILSDDANKINTPKLFLVLVFSDWNPNWREENLLMDEQSGIYEVVASGIASFPYKRERHLFFKLSKPLTASQIATLEETILRRKPNNLAVLPDRPHCRDRRPFCQGNGFTSPFSLPVQTDPMTQYVPLLQ